EFRPDNSAALRLRCISAHSLDWGHRGGIRSGTSLRLGLRSQAKVPAAPWTGNYGGLRDSTRHEHLRRSGALDHAEICSLHRALISECQQISAVTSVPSDDARLRPLFLWSIDGGTPQFLRPALVLGKVPMFYYLLHFP